MTVSPVAFSGFGEASSAEVVVSTVLDVKGLEVLGFDDVGVVAVVDMALLGADDEDVIPGVVARDTVAGGREIELVLSPTGDCVRADVEDPSRLAVVVLLTAVGLMDRKLDAEVVETIGGFEVGKVVVVEVLSPLGVDVLIVVDVTA
jgi:hypothetical protein